VAWSSSLTSLISTGSGYLKKVTIKEPSWFSRNLKKPHRTIGFHERTTGFLGGSLTFPEKMITVVIYIFDNHSSRYQKGYFILENHGCHPYEPL
jgi:hypothetical protein